MSDPDLIINKQSVVGPTVGVDAPIVPVDSANTWNALQTFSGGAVVPTMAIGDNTTNAASTAFVQAALVHTPGIRNINSIIPTPLNPDGQTSNVSMFQSLAPLLQGVGTELPVVVNFAGGSPAVLSLNPTAASGGTLPNNTTHFLKPNQAFFFQLSAGGVLPTGISLNTRYYITAANLTATTFTFSTVNNYGLTSGGTFTSEGSPVNTTGSLTGTLSIVLTGRSVSVTIPPGAYFGGNFGSGAANVNVTPNGMTKVRYFCYDCYFDTKTSFGVVGSPNNCIYDAKTWAIGPNDLINTTPNDNNLPVNVDGLITLQTTANAVNYYPGGWASIFGYNNQDPLGTGVSGPPNSQYQEYAQIKAVNTGTGVLTDDGPQKWVYLSTFPQMFTPHSVFVAGGAASIAPMHPAWDCEVQIIGATFEGQPTATCARSVVYEDCIFRGYGNSPAQTAPSVAQSYIYRNCTFGPSGTPGQMYMEVDKMLRYLELDNCKFGQNKYRIQFTSPSLHTCNIKGGRGAQILGTPRRIKVDTVELDSLLVGPFLGTTDVCTIINSPVKYFDMQARSDDPVDLLTNAVGLRPGNDMTLVPNWTFSNGTFTRNITGLPGSQAMNWQAPGLKGYMIDAGGIYKANQNMGSPFAVLNPRMDGSGNFSFDTSLKVIPTRQKSHTVTVTIAAPGVFTWAAHAMPAGTPVCLVTTGALPTGLLTSTVYYVANDSNLTTNTFSLSDTLAHANAGTNQITTTGSQSGTHTAYGNPLCFRVHPCPRFTSIGNSGSTKLVALNGAVDEPLFSRWSGAFVGKQQTSNPAGFQVPLPEIWGYLKSLIINVRQAGTSSGTLTISCPGFKQSDNSLDLSTFSQVIDTTVAGVRSWVGSAAPSGSAGADSIAAYADWVSGPLIFTPSAATTLAASYEIEIEIRTDQGITRYSNMIGAPGTPASSFTWQWSDSGIVQQFGSTP